MAINPEVCKYDWVNLANSMQEVGVKSPLIVELTKEGGFIVTEGKHRFGAASLIKPFNLDFKLPCLLVARDIFYTAKMWKQRHPNPVDSEGFTTYTSK